MEKPTCKFNLESSLFESPNIFCQISSHTIAIRFAVTCIKGNTPKKDHNIADMVKTATLLASCCDVSPNIIKPVYIINKH